MRSKECQAPYHSENCPCPSCLRDNCDKCYSTEEDHFTPRCVIKKNHNRFNNNKENLQYLSKPCHRIKDRSTPSRKHHLVFSSIEKLRDWRNANDLVFKDEYDNNEK